MPIFDKIQISLLRRFMGLMHLNSDIIGQVITSSAFRSGIKSIGVSPDNSKGDYSIQCDNHLEASHCAQYFIRSKGWLDDNSKNNPRDGNFLYVYFRSDSAN